MPKSIGGHFSRESHYKSHIKEDQPPVYRAPAPRNQCSLKERSQGPLEIAQFKASLVARQKMREAKESSVAQQHTLYGKTIVLDLRNLKIMTEEDFTLLVADDQIHQVPEVLQRLLDEELESLRKKKN